MKGVIKNTIDKIKAKSSRKNRIKGQIKTVLATTAATALTMGLVTNPIGILALTVVSLVFGVSAGKNALNTEDNDNINEEEDEEAN
jgi:hypothetical protein